MRGDASPAPAPPAPPHVLVTWDVDGTILTTRGDRANRLQKRAFAAAWRGVHGLDLDVDAVPHQGLTDPLILLIVAEQSAGIPLARSVEKLDELTQAMLAYYQDNIADSGEGLHLLDGVGGVLAALAARPGVTQGLVTGNLRPIANAKMDALCVRHHFTPDAGGGGGFVGGYGSDFCGGAAGVAAPHEDRAQLLRVAADRAAEAAGGAPPTARIHVGDTPYDVLAAVAAGAVPVGVTTGVHTKQELEAVAPPGTVILDSMADVEGAVAAILGAAGVSV